MSEVTYWNICNSQNRCIFTENNFLLFLYTNLNVRLISYPLPTHMFVGPLSPGANIKDYSAHWHLGSCSQTLDSPKISIRRHQTPNERIGTLRDVPPPKKMQLLLGVFQTRSTPPPGFLKLLAHFSASSLFWGTFGALFVS